MLVAHESFSEDDHRAFIASHSSSIRLLEATNSTLTRSYSVTIGILNWKADVPPSVWRSLRPNYQWITSTSVLLNQPTLRNWRDYELRASTGIATEPQPEFLQRCRNG